MSRDISSKHVFFSMNGNIHKLMRQYLMSISPDVTMKDYITNLIVKDLRNKNILKSK